MTTCNYNYDVVRKAVCAAYFTNAAKIKSIGDFSHLYIYAVELHDTNCLCSRSMVDLLFKIA